MKDVYSQKRAGDLYKNTFVFVLLLVTFLIGEKKVSKGDYLINADHAILIGWLKIPFLGELKW